MEATAMRQSERLLGDRQAFHLRFLLMAQTDDQRSYVNLVG